MDTPEAVVDRALQDAAANPAGIVDSLIEAEDRFEALVQVKLCSPRHWARLVRGLTGAGVSAKDVKLLESSVAHDAKKTKPKAELADQRQKVAGATTPEEKAEAIASLREMVKAFGDSGDPAMAAVELVRESGATLFHDRANEGYITFPIDTHFETWPLRSRGFRLWLRKIYFDEYGAALKKSHVAEAKEQLETEALFVGDEMVIHTRIGGYGNAVYIDLCDDQWRVIEITTNGFRVTKQPPIKFVRHPDALPLPVPEPGGTLTDIRAFLNITDEQWPLVAGCLLAFARPVGPYPILILGGEQGSAKSSTAKVIRRLVDPHSPLITGAVSTERDLSIVARSEWLVNFSNLSSISDHLSDSLCRLVYGEGFQTRRLYTDDDIAGFSEPRPVILNGISEIVSRSDLLDRSVIIRLGRITEKTRQEEHDFWAAFEKAWPRLFGAVCDAVAKTLARHPSVKLARPPRMADFARWASAGELAMGLQDGGFMAAYEQNLAEAHLIALEASVLTDPLRIFVSRLPGPWEGTAGDLLQELMRIVPHEKEMPKTGQYLSIALDRLAPNLRHAGIDVAKGKRQAGTGKRLIRIQAVTP